MFAIPVAGWRLSRLDRYYLWSYTIGVWHVEYYTEPGGRQPVAEWLDALDRKARANVDDKVVRLQQHGLMLLNTNMMKSIRGYGADFYELRYSGYRVALYHDTAADHFVLLHGFKKERRRESREIETAYARLRECRSRG